MTNGDPSEKPPAFSRLEGAREEIERQLFELTIRSAWYDTLMTSMQTFSFETMQTTYHEADFVKHENLPGPLTIDEPTLMKARLHLKRALGEKSVNQDRLKQKVDQVLGSELEQYGIELYWIDSYPYLGSTTALAIRLKTEAAANN